MAGRIQGITIEIDANASKFQSEIKKIDKELKSTKSTLKDVDKLLKLDPTNTTLLTQKQKALKDAITETKDRLKLLRDEQKNIKEGTPEWDALQREIIATEQNLKSLEDQYRDFGSVAKQQLQAVGKSMQDFGGKVQKVGRDLSKISGVAAGMLTALGKIGYDAIQSADDLATVAQQTGVSTDQLQKWNYASQLVDVSVESMTGAVKKLKKGMGSGSKALEELGIKTTNADGSFRSVTSVFYETLQALSQIDNETERDIKAMDIFGKSADELAGIIDDGGEALRQYGIEAQNMGLIMGEETIGELLKASDTIEKTKANLSMSFAQLGGTLIETFGPALEKVVGYIGKLTEKLRQLTPEQAETIVKVLAVVAVIGPLVTIIGTLITGIGGIVTAISFLFSPIGLVVAAIAAVIAIGVTLYKHWDEIKEWAKQTAENISEAWNNMKEKVVNTVNNLKSKVATAWDNMKSTAASKLDSLKSTVSAKWENIKDAVRAGVQVLQNLMNFNWQLPHLAMPHFSISGKFSLDPPSVPHLSVQWYKKAYENAVMFSSPTVMATPYGMKGFGDGHGAEIVLGLDRLRELVSSQTRAVVINVYGSQGQNVDELADKIQARFIAMSKQRSVIGA